MAVRTGFEPVIRVNVYTLSRRAPSATRTSHQNWPYNFTVLLRYCNFILNKNEIYILKVQHRLLQHRKIVILEIDHRKVFHLLYLHTQRLI